MIREANLMKLLHAGIERARHGEAAGLSYLMNAHRLDFETSGIILLAMSKPVLIALANLFSSEKPAKTYLRWFTATRSNRLFEVDAKLARTRQGGMSAWTKKTGNVPDF